MTTTPEECLDALREAARRLGESPTKAQYEALDVTPSTTTILRVLGGWNEAKERAGLETYTRTEGGGRPVEPKPADVEIPADCTWEGLTPQQRWYYKNREYRIERKEVRRRKLQRWLTEYKHEHCECEGCGESHPASLDFHHVGEKKLNISQMANHGYSRERIEQEMEVCIVVCANCHRREHANTGTGRTTTEPNETRHRRKRRAWIDAYKRESGGCERCEESTASCLDFHHVGEKTTGIARMVSQRRPPAEIKRELERCELLCANCHRKEHHGGTAD